jgi:methylated-DNA-[protein]-cysteine S-methyltransferase
MRTNELKRLGRGTDDRAAAAARGFLERARDDGLVDVGFGFADSPFGPLLVAMSGRGLVRLAYPNERPDDVLAELAANVSPRVLESAGATDPIRRELDEYFEGRRRGFSVPTDFALSRGFTRAILQRTAKIPFGHLATYREMATAAGSPRGARAAGNALGSNPIPIVVPCHRVVHADGGLGGYTGGIDRKVVLLRLEGVLDEESVRPRSIGADRLQR